MKNFIHLVFFLITFILKTSNAQDTIKLKSDQKIIGSVLEISDFFIFYSKNIAGNNVNLKISRSNVTQISYKNGQIEKFELGSDSNIPNAIIVKKAFNNENLGNYKFKASIIDSFNFKALSPIISYFDLVKSKSPLFGFSEGIYMVSERIWFYKVPDSTKLYSFAISQTDTSTYIFFDYNNAIFLVNYKGDTKNQEIITNLLKLDKKHAYTLFPFDKLKYFLLSKDSVSNVFLCNSHSYVKVLNSKQNICNILPIGSDKFIACYADKLVLNNLKNSEKKLLFKSSIPIISAVIIPTGAPVISTSQGIFWVNKNYSVTKIDLPIYDGILKLYNNYLYVLSNKRKMIYKIIIS